MLQKTKIRRCSVGGTDQRGGGGRRLLPATSMTEYFGSFEGAVQNGFEGDFLKEGFWRFKRGESVLLKCYRFTGQTRHSSPPMVISSC